MLTHCKVLISIELCIRLSFQKYISCTFKLRSFTHLYHMRPKEINRLLHQLKSNPIIIRISLIILVPVALKISTKKQLKIKYVLLS